MQRSTKHRFAYVATIVLVSITLVNASSHNKFRTATNSLAKILSQHKIDQEIIDNTIQKDISVRVDPKSSSKYINYSDHVMMEKWLIDNINDLHRELKQTETEFEHFSDVTQHIIARNEVAYQKELGLLLRALAHSKHGQIAREYASVSSQTW